MAANATGTEAPVATPATTTPHHGTPAIVPASAAAASAIAAASTAGSTYASPRTSEPLTAERVENTSGSPGRSAFVFSACAVPAYAGKASTPRSATTCDRQTCCDVSLPAGATPVPSTP